MALKDNCTISTHTIYSELSLIVDCNGSQFTICNMFTEAPEVLITYCELMGITWECSVEILGNLAWGLQAVKVG